MRKYFGILGVAAAWVVIYLVFWYLNPRSFGRIDEIETLMRQVAVVGFGAIGMTYIIIAGGIDLSAGSLVALITVVVGLILQKGYSPALAIVGALAAGALCGLFNGAMITRLRVGAFIVTLATMDAFRGIAKGLGHENEVVAPDTWINDLTNALAPGEHWKLFPIGTWLMLATAAFAAWALRFTVFGRQVVAIGSNAHAAKLSGIRVQRVTVWVYIIGGLCLAIAGIMEFSRITIGDPTVAVGLELDIIAAVVIGGGSLTGGEGNIFASLIGALIMETIRAGCTQRGWPNWIQDIITGLIILVAVGVDRWRIARAANK